MTITDPIGAQGSPGISRTLLTMKTSALIERCLGHMQTNGLQSSFRYLEHFEPYKALKARADSNPDEVITLIGGPLNSERASSYFGFFKVVLQALEKNGHETTSLIGDPYASTQEKIDAIRHLLPQPNPEGDGEAAGDADGTGLSAAGYAVAQDIGARAEPRNGRAEDSKESKDA